MKKLSIILASIALVLAGAASATASAVPVALDEGGGAVTGTVVDSTSGKPVRFVLVLAYQEDYSTLIGVTLTSRDGSFGLEVPDEEFALRFVSLPRRYESGWLACDKTVVPTTDESCTTGPGDLGTVLLDRR